VVPETPRNASRNSGRERGSVGSESVRRLDLHGPTDEGSVIRSLPSVNLAKRSQAGFPRARIQVVDGPGAVEQQPPVIPNRKPNVGRSARSTSSNFPRRMAVISARGQRFHVTWWRRRPFTYQASGCGLAAVGRYPVGELARGLDLR
jgi:hypothetical protein